MRRRNLPVVRHCEGGARVSLPVSPQALAFLLDMASLRRAVALVGDGRVEELTRGARALVAGVSCAPKTAP